MTTSGRCGPEDVAEVVLGVDTHLDFHVAVVLDPLGRYLGESKAPTTLKGYRKLLSWAEVNKGRKKDRSCYYTPRSPVGMPLL